MTTQTDELATYLQKEREYLRSRLGVNIDETGALERQAILSTGALWAWFATHPVVSGFPVLAALPLILTVFLGFRAIAVYLRMQTLRAYLAKLERIANLPDGLGWATSLESTGGRYRFWTATIFWTGINVLNLVFAWIFPHVPLA